MKETAIDFQWTQKNNTYSKMLDRKKVFVIFKGLAEGYIDDGNEISIKMVEEIIPFVDKIYINRDFNQTQDDPIISYEINGELNVLKIKRHHKIIWSILDRYCAE